MEALPMFVLVRFLAIFYIGVFATLAWQGYGGAAREAIASRSPRLAWLVPPAEPASASPGQIIAISRDLVVVRQSVDELAAKLQTLQQSAPGRTSESQSSPAAVRKRGVGR
jgi:hypothetical protein